MLFLEMNDSLSVSQRHTLNEWLDRQSQATLGFFEEITDRGQLDKDLEAYAAIDVPKALKDVQRRIASARPDQAREQRGVADPPHRRQRSKLAAIAILGILLTGAVLLTWQHAKRKTTTENVALTPMAHHYRNDVPPGGARAVLTLADGSQIELDNAANGKLARQGATQVMKLDAGKLAYSPAGTAGSAGQSPGSRSSNKPALTAYNTISTPRGGQYQVLLPDGSKVWLNAASSLRFPTVFTGKERRVELSGEAYFEISRNASSPFKVSIAPSSRSNNGGGAGTFSPAMEIEVLGTAFNVEAYADEEDQRATLLSGAVKVTTGDGQSLLAPGQQARLRNVKGAALQVGSHVNTDGVLAWKAGSFLFQDATIESIMRQLARWYNVDVEYEGEKPVQRLTANVSRNNNLSDILRVLEISGYHFDIRGRAIIVKN